jgi:hypothetical protein
MAGDSPIAAASEVTSSTAPFSSAAFSAAAAFAAAAFAAAAFAAAVLAEVDRADAVRAVLFAAADLAAADFAAAVLAAVVFPPAAFPAAVFPAAVFAGVGPEEVEAAARAAAARAAEVAGLGDFAATARAALFFAAALRAAAVVRAEVSDEPWLGASSIIFTAGSMTISPAGAAVSADAFAGLRGAVFFTAGARFVGAFFVVGRPAELCSGAGAPARDAFWGGVSESSTWSVRSSGEGVTVLRYQWVAPSQGRHATIRARIPKIPRTVDSIVYPECSVCSRSRNDNGAIDPRAFSGGIDTMNAAR